MVVVIMKNCVVTRKIDVLTMKNVAVTMTNSVVTMKNFFSMKHLTCNNET